MLKFFKRFVLFFTTAVAIKTSSVKKRVSKLTVMIIKIREMK